MRVITASPLTERSPFKNVTSRRAPKRTSIQEFKENAKENLAGTKSPLKKQFEQRQVMHEINALLASSDPKQLSPENLRKRRETELELQKEIEDILGASEEE